MSNSIKLFAWDTLLALIHFYYIHIEEKYKDHITVPRQFSKIAEIMFLLIVWQQQKACCYSWHLDVLIYRESAI